MKGSNTFSKLLTFVQNDDDDVDVDGDVDDEVAYFSFISNWILEHSLWFEFS